MPSYFFLIEFSFLLNYNSFLTVVLIAVLNFSSSWGCHWLFQHHHVIWGLIQQMVYYGPSPSTMVLWVSSCNCKRQARLIRHMTETNRTRPRYGAVRWWRQAAGGEAGTGGGGGASERGPSAGRDPRAGCTAVLEHFWGGKSRAQMGALLFCVFANQYLCVGFVDL